MAKVTSSAVSVILPVLNEENYLEAAVKAVLSQDFSGAIEVLLAVGPSKDRTLEIANKLAAADKRVKVVANPSGRTAAGLNLAIKNSSHPIIVRVDGHAKIPNNYISIAVQLLEETGAVNVGGVMAAEGETPFERAVAGAMRSPLGVGAAKFHTGGSAGETDTVYLGVFRRAAIDAIGGFDEHFTRAQDWELNFRLRKN
ncbi:MAG: glycosyltransferase, partial [Candidatus Nanopelagicaceae bacterium]